MARPILEETIDNERAFKLLEELKPSQYNVAYIANFIREWEKATARLRRIGK